MGNPFTYPKSKHTRTLFPPQYNNYRQYKPTLQQEFHHQCVYCRTIDKVRGYDNFGVDHYRPQKSFPSLTTEYLNLFYSCNRCNNRKRAFWPSPAQMKDGLFVPNPCEHVMFDHLRYQGGAVVSKSRAGDWSIDLLDLNDPSEVTHRFSIIKALEVLHLYLSQSMKTLERMDIKLETRLSGPEKSLATTRRQEVEGNIAELRAAIQNLGG